MKAATCLSCLTLGLALTSWTVFAQPINLAPAGTATASSVLSDNPVPAASKAIDGNRDGAYGNHSVWHSSCSDAAWLEMDLGNTFYLDRVQIFPWVNYDYPVTNFTIQVRDASNVVVFQQNYFTNGDRINLGTAWGTADMRGLQGRYVRMSRNAVQCTALAEVEVYGQSMPILTNLALNKPVTDTAGTCCGTAVASGNDGNLDGDYQHAGNPIYHSASQGVGTFWQVDLQSTNQLGYVLIFPRKDWATTSTVKLSVLDGTQSTVWFTNVNISPNVIVLNASQYDIPVPIPAGVTGRYVRMETTLNEFLAFGELQVFPSLPSFSTAGYWNGLQGSAWDAGTTANWSTNLNIAPLGSATFSQAMALSGGTAVFADSYYNNGTAIPVTQSNVTVAAGGVSTTTVNFQSAAVNYTVSGADSAGITGTTAVNKSGAATLTLAGGNTYSGATFISVGAIKLGAAYAVSNSTVTVGAANGLTFGTGIGTFALGGLAGGANLALSDTGGSAVTLQVGGNGGSSTYAGVMSGNGAVTKAGGGTLTLTSRSSYTGGTMVNEGTLVINAPNSGDSAIGTGTLTIGPSGRVDTYVNGFGGFYQNPIVINGGTLHQVAADSHLNTVTMTGGMLSGGPGTVFYLRNNSVTVNASAATSTISVPYLNVWGGTVFDVADGAAATDLLVSSGEVQGGGYLTKTGAGTMVLTGVGTYAGVTTVNQGTLALGGNGSLASPLITVAGGATFDVSGLSSPPFALGASRTLANSGATTANVTGNVSAGSGTVALSYTDGTPSFTTSGTLTLTGGTTFTVNNTGAQLGHGNHKLIAKSGAGSVTGLPSSYSITGGGAATPHSLRIVGDELYLTVNNAPVAVHATNSVPQGESVNIPLNNGKFLLATDADGDTLTITSVSASLGNVSTDGSSINYTNTSAGATDSISYTVSDGLGGTDTKTINVLITSATGANLLSATAGEGNAYLSYAGIPGYKYALDKANGITPPITWVPQVTNTATGQGALNYTNVLSLAPTNDFFRTRHVP